MMAVVMTQHLKMVGSLREKMRWAPMAEPLTVVVVQMMKAPTATGLAVDKQQETRTPSRMVQTMKVRDPAVRLRGQMLEAVVASQSLIMQITNLQQPHE